MTNAMNPNGLRAATLYFLAVVAANLTATLFIPFPVFGQVAVGTFIFGITFTQRDKMHREGGRAFVYKVLFITAVATTLMLLGYKYLLAESLVAALSNAGQTWLATGFGILAESSERVLVASFLAIILAEAADTEIYHLLKNRSWLVRVASSNAVSVPLDSLIFNLVAFAGIFGAMELASIIFGEIVVKYLVGIGYGWWLGKRLKPTNKNA